jgi:hypothetical protein
MAQARIERVMFSIHLKLRVREVNFRRRGTIPLLSLIFNISSLCTFNSSMHIAKQKKKKTRVSRMESLSIHFSSRKTNFGEMQDH